MKPEALLIDESTRRIYQKLHDVFGDKITAFLADPDINEVMLNPDGKLWVDRSSVGQEEVGVFNGDDAYRIMTALASINRTVITHEKPRLEAQLPIFKEMKGERFTGQIRPVAPSPCFTIRKRSETVFSLDDYVVSNRMTQQQATILKQLIRERKNILVVGGPGTGKTTVTNALIIEAVNSDPNQRFMLLEDLPELQCTAINKVPLLTTEHVTMTDLVRTAMRMRPDRILVGEVRGKEAFDMLKAWNTGCPGGICTVHANGAEEGIQRILDLAMEAGLTVPPIQLVMQTVDVVVSIIRNGNQKGFLNNILTIKEYKDGAFEFTQLG
jgi:type IV secretion system protein TrbB